MSRKLVMLGLISAWLLETVQAQPISPASPSAREIWRLYNVVLILGVLVGLVSLGFLIAFTLKYRERRPAEAPTGPVVDKDLVRVHMVTSLSYFILGGTFAVIASLQQVVGGTTVLSTGQLEISITEHYISTIWGWGLLGILGLCYFFLPNLLNVRIFSASAASASLWLINIGVIGSLLSFPDVAIGPTLPAKVPPLLLASQLLVGLGFYIGGFNVVVTFVEGSRGKKYLEIPTVAVFLLVSVVLFLGGSALYTGFMVVLLLKEFVMPKAVVDPLFARNLLSFVFKPMLFMFALPTAGALCHYIPEKVGRELRGRNVIYKLAIPLLVILAFVRWWTGLNVVPVWAARLGELVGLVMLIPVVIVIAGSLSTLSAGSQTSVWDIRTRLLAGAAIAWLYASILGALTAVPRLSQLFAGKEILFAEQQLLVLGVYSMGVLAVMSDVWGKLDGRELFGQTFGKAHFAFTLIGVFGITAATLVSSIIGIKDRSIFGVSYGEAAVLLLAIFILAFAIPQYGYSLQVFRSFLDLGIRKVWGAFGLLVGFGLANAAIYGLAANKFGLTLLTGLITAAGGAFILFFSIVILLSEGPKPSTASTPP